MKKDYCKYCKRDITNETHLELNGNLICFYCVEKVFDTILKEKNGQDSTA